MTTNATDPKNGARWPVYRSLEANAALRWLASLLDAFVDVLEPAIARFSSSRRIIVIETVNDLEIFQARGNRVTRIGNAGSLDEKARRTLRAGRHNNVELRFRQECILQTSLKVPASGLAYVEQIIEARLDRLTPWKADKVLYGFKGGSKPGTDGQVDVRIAATTKETATDAIGRLDLLGLKPSTMGSSSDPLEQPLAIDLFRGRSDTGRLRRRKRIGRVAMAFASLALFAYAASTYWAMQSAEKLATIDRHVVEARRKLVEGAGNPADRQLDLDYIARKTLPNARFALIDRLAGIIPENTFLDELDIEQDSFRIAGTSSEASALIEIIEAEPTLSDAKFSAPVTRQPDGRDHFDITAALTAPSAAKTP